MDENKLRKYAGLDESEILSEAPEANAMFADMREILEEFRDDRQRVRKSFGT